MPLLLSWLEEPSVIGKEENSSCDSSAKRSSSVASKRSPVPGVAPWFATDDDAAVPRQCRLDARAPGCRVSPPEPPDPCCQPTEAPSLCHQSVVPITADTALIPAFAATLPNYRAGVILERRAFQSTQNRGGAPRTRPPIRGVLADFLAGSSNCKPVSTKHASHAGIRT